MLRRLPHNIEAEQAVIGSLLVYGKKAFAAVGELTEQHFMLAEHQALWARCVEMIAAGTMPDPVTLRTWAEEEPLFEGNGPAYLLSLADGAVHHRVAAGYARSIIDDATKRRIIEITDVISDHAYNGKPSDAVVREALAAFGSVRPILRKEWLNAADIDPKNLEYIWRNRLLANVVNIIAGMGDVGKDVFCCTVAACITTGRDWPDGEKGCEPGDVGIISPEDRPDDTIVPRLIAAGADRSKVKIWSGINKTTPHDIRGLKALIVSPLISLMDKDQKMNSEQDARDFLELWTSALEQHRCTVIGTAHYGKRTDGPVVQKILGASGIANFVRSNWAIQRNPEDETERLFMRLKANLSPDSVNGLRFGIEHVGPWSQSIVCTWRGTTDQTPDEVMRDATNGAKKQSAERWLVEYLKRHGGMAQASTVIESGEKEGYSEVSIKKAQQRNHSILAVRHGEHGKGRGAGKWWWQLSKLAGMEDGLNRL